MNAQSVDLKGRPRPSPFVLALGVGAVALLVRLLYVQFFSTPIPYWDQWDGEWVTALRPWLDGSLQWNTLLTAHNEHRILLTRLVTLTTYQLTGEWNNVYEARVSAVLYCFIPALLVWQATRDTPQGRSRWPLVVVALLLSTLPFAHENFLVGFQSQFYFLILTSVAAIALVARHHQRPLALFGAVVLSGLAMVSMASGVLTAVAVAATSVLACLCLPGRRVPGLCAAAIMLVMAVLVYSTIPVIAGHAVLRAQSVGELLLAATHVLAWPARDNGVVVLVWLPSIVMVSRMLIRRSATPTELVMAGLCIWSGMQGMAIAYGRGHDGMRSPASRYTELLVPGVFANAWFALQLWGLVPEPSKRRLLARTVVVLFFLLLFGATLSRVSKDLGTIRKFHAACELQQQNVVDYLISKDPKILELGLYELPYPDAAQLKQHLDNPALLPVLPEVVRNEVERGSAPLP